LRATAAGVTHTSRRKRPDPAAQGTVLLLLGLQPPPTPTLFPYTTLFRSPASPTPPRGETRGGDPGAGPPRVEIVSVKDELVAPIDRKSTRLNSSHVAISYAVFCLKKKK